MKLKNLNPKNSKAHSGFTLIEVMVVIVVIGLMASLVQFNFSSNKTADLLKNESAKFAAIFEVAAEFGMLNNIELGLIVHKDRYQFVGYDGTKWQEVPNQNWQASVQLPEEVMITIELDDLPIEDPLLIDTDTFTEKDEEDFTLRSKEEEEEKIIPQVYILSGGDFTPFSVTFQLSEELSYLSEDEELAYRVTGIYDIPLTIEGPILED